MYNEKVMEEYLSLMMGYIDEDNTYEAIEAIKAEADTKGHKEEVLEAASKFFVKHTAHYRKQ